MLMVGEDGWILVDGPAPFVIFGILYLCRLRLLFIVVEGLGTFPGVSGGGSF